ETAIRDKISFQVLEAPPESKGKVRLFGVDIPIDITIIGDDKKLFDAEKVSLNSAGAALGKPVTEGQNAVMYINGERVERNSNEFTVSGMSFELKETFYESYAAEKAAAENAGTAFKPDAAKFESIDVTRNTDQIFDGVKKFMDEYNKIVENTWSMLKAETTYKDYPPLTDKQKDDMSEHEIELWEKKSQEGLMRRDETMTAIMDSMRQVLTARPAGSKYSLADMGISVGYDMEKGYGGKLIFNDNAATGEKLKEMIAQEPEALEKLFADYDTGLLPELNRVFEAAVGPGKGGKYNKLSLQDLAGSPTMPDTSSKMYKEAKAIDENLTNLNRKYKAEYTRYWKQFNNMEQMIQQMNQQSSWLTQQLGN
ncbi:MAG: flagellar filament capping protein FliD, partial [Angelakisella sp.]